MGDDVRKINPSFKLSANDDIDDMIVLNNGNKICPILWKKAESQIKDALETSKAITGREHELTSVGTNDNSFSSIKVGVQIKSRTDVS